MPQSLVGAKAEKKIVVTDEYAISFLGLDTARVLSTPNMIQFMEWTSRDAVFPLLDPGFDTVGTIVNVAHLAATPMGMTVTFTAEVIEVDNRRVRFRVEAYDAKEKVGEGTHERFIINVERFAERLQAKKREAAG